MSYHIQQIMETTKMLNNEEAFLVSSYDELMIKGYTELHKLSCYQANDSYDKIILKGV